MSKESRALLTVVHRMINKDVSATLAAITDGPIDEREALLKLGDEEIKLLRGIRFSSVQREALRQALMELSRGIVFGILCIIDGVAYTESEDIPDLALVDRDTGKNIADMLLHDEFYEVVD